MSLISLTKIFTTALLVLALNTNDLKVDAASSFSSTSNTTTTIQSPPPSFSLSDLCSCVPPNKQTVSKSLLLVEYFYKEFLSNITFYQDLIESNFQLIECFACAECVANATTVCGNLAETEANIYASNTFQKAVVALESCAESLSPQAVGFLSATTSQTLPKTTPLSEQTACDCCLTDAPEQVTLHPTGQNNSIIVRWVQRHNDSTMAYVAWGINSTAENLVSGKNFKNIPYNRRKAIVLLLYTYIY